MSRWSILSKHQASLSTSTTSTTSARASYSPGQPALAKLWIASIDNPRIELRAQYNPKELQIDKQVPWNEHKQRNNRSGRRREDDSEQSDLEFNGAAIRTMQIELLFDGYEEGESVQPDVDLLEELSTVSVPREPGPGEARPREAGPGESRKELRPHHCLIAWGAQEGGMRPFRCVIESLSTKYTMWSSEGTPLRATCTIKVKEAEKMSPGPEDLRYDAKKRDRFRRSR